MTKPPCWTKETGDCPRRYIGCRAECKDWHNWLVIHDKEMDAIKRDKDMKNVIDGYFIERAKMLKKGTQAKYERDKRKLR